MRRVRPATAALATVLALLTPGLTSCGDEEPSDTGSDPDPVTIEITVEGGTVEPSGERVDVAVGQRIELVVMADSNGEIHVHSEPEQQLEYGEGTTTLPMTIDNPGVVDVEAHDLEQIIVQLEVE
ncbi:MAG: hypothetical protein ACXWXO_20810 [Nocardioides sp.]